MSKKMRMTLATGFNLDKEGNSQQEREQGDGGRMGGSQL